MMHPIYLLLFLISSSFESYQELPKFGSVEALPDSKVYINISSYSIGELIFLEFGVDYSTYYSFDKNYRYDMKIGQVSASNHYDQKEWNSLTSFTNENRTCNSRKYCIFTWEEIKQKGNNFIYILPSEPYSGYYSNDGKKIKISMIEEGKKKEEEKKEQEGTKESDVKKEEQGGKGLGAGAIVGIVFGCVGIISLIISIILYYRTFSKRKSYNPISNSAAPLVPYVKPTESTDYVPPAPTQTCNN